MCFSDSKYCRSQQQAPKCGSGEQSVANVESGPRLKSLHPNRWSVLIAFLTFQGKEPPNRGRRVTMLQCYKLHNSGYLFCILYTEHSHPRDSRRKNIPDNILRYTGCFNKMELSQTSIKLFICFHSSMKFILDFKLAAQNHIELNIV